MARSVSNERDWYTSPMKSVALSVACITFAWVSPVLAATVIVTSNPVYLSSGNGFHQISGSKVVGPGASLMAKSGGRAELIFDDGCRVVVNAEVVIHVGSQGKSGSLKDTPAEVSPCALGELDPGLTGGTALASSYIVAAAAAAVGAVAVGVAAGTGTSNDSGPVSP